MKEKQNEDGLRRLGKFTRKGRKEKERHMILKLDGDEVTGSGN